MTPRAQIAETPGDALLSAEELATLARDLEATSPAARERLRVVLRER